MFTIVTRPSTHWIRPTCYYRTSYHREVPTETFKVNIGPFTQMLNPVVAKRRKECSQHGQHFTQIVIYLFELCLNLRIIRYIVNSGSQLHCIPASQRRYSNQFVVHSNTTWYNTTDRQTDSHWWRKKTRKYPWNESNKHTAKLSSNGYTLQCMLWGLD
jgi:hypothetical protein